MLGFPAEELDQLVAAQEATEGLTDADAVPPVPPVPVSQPGDLWVLGDHRLLCGDATQRLSLETVLGGDSAAMVFTDPPYNVAYQGKTRRKLTLVNDALGTGFAQFLRQSCDHLVALCQGAIYICMSSSELHTCTRHFWPPEAIGPPSLFGVSHSSP